MAAVFAIVFGFLVALVNIASWSPRVAFEEFLVRTAWLAVFGAAAYAVFLIWRNHFYTPKPKAPPSGPSTEVISATTNEPSAG